MTLTMKSPSDKDLFEGYIRLKVHSIYADLCP